jgi:hypothetical protein
LKYQNNFTIAVQALAGPPIARLKNRQKFTVLYTRRHPANDDVAFHIFGLQPSAQPLSSEDLPLSNAVSRSALLFALHRRNAPAPTLFADAVLGCDHLASIASGTRIALFGDGVPH